MIDCRFSIKDNLSVVSCELSVATNFRKPTVQGRRTRDDIQLTSDQVGNRQSKMNACKMLASKRLAVVNNRTLPQSLKISPNPARVVCREPISRREDIGVRGACATRGVLWVGTGVSGLRRVA